MLEPDLLPSPVTSPTSTLPRPGGGGSLGLWTFSCHTQSPSVSDQTRLLSSQTLSASLNHMLMLGVKAHLTTSTHIQRQQQKNSCFQVVFCVFVFLSKAHGTKSTSVSHDLTPYPTPQELHIIIESLLQRGHPPGVMASAELMQAPNPGITGQRARQVRPPRISIYFLVT